MTAEHDTPPPRAEELPAESLRWRCRPEDLGFRTTAELDGAGQVVGQPRAVEAVEFGVAIRSEGFNIFALGATGTGRHTLVRDALGRHAAAAPPGSDWCYVHNFEKEHQPRLLRLPAGRGAALRQHMTELLHELHSVLPAAFESEEYQTRRKALDEELEGRQRAAWEELAAAGRTEGLSVVHTPMGLVFAPTRDDEVLSPKEYEELAPAERERVEAEVHRLRGDVERLLGRLPGWMREHRRRLEELRRDVARLAIAPLFDDLRRVYADVTEVCVHLDAVEAELVERAHALARRERGREEENAPDLQEGPLRRYSVNLLVDHGEESGAPVVYEHNPTLPNLVGRVEHLAQLGVLVTDFRLIKPGALHRANGGYLVLDVDRVLRQPLVWDALKRALRSGRVEIESVAEALSLQSTVTLDPEPMPLEVKVVLVGEPLLYYLLAAYDPEFSGLFKVAADFAERLGRDVESQQAYARMLAGLARGERLRPLDATAMGRVLEESARLAADAQKLSLRLDVVLDLLREADYLAGQAGREVIAAAQVAAAVESRIRRADRLREEILQDTSRGLLLIATEGETIGQVNGLSYVRLDSFAFGRPVRITARVRLGDGEVVDIEREVELAGPVHSKGVLILAGFLGERYASGFPLSLHASLVFEQSYGEIEGDSASLAELCALLSAIGEVPLAQEIAITGSVNQRGEVQAVGGVNEKVEGFFDLCAARGLTGRQGVVLPAANASQLMLRDDVVEAVAEGRFHLWAVTRADEAMELLAGLAAGERDTAGDYPEGSVNARVEARLAELAAMRASFERARVLVGEPASGGGPIATVDAPTPEEP